MTTMSEKELRELDIYIAEHVMGWKKMERAIDISKKGEFAFHIDQVLTQGPRTAWELIQFHPTTDPAAAFAVLEKCRERYKHSNRAICTGRSPIGFEAYLDGDYEKTNRMAPTLPLAICLFAKQLFQKKD